MFDKNTTLTVGDNPQLLNIFMLHILSESVL